jgi:5-aminolevulinate synthase
MVGDPVLCKAITDALLQEFQIYVQPINYPTVPKGTERLRLTPAPLHSEQNIEHLVSCLSLLWERFGLQKTEQNLQEAA